MRQWVWTKDIILKQGRGPRSCCQQEEDPLAQHQECEQQGRGRHPWLSPHLTHHVTEVCLLHGEPDLIGISSNYQI